MDLRRNLRRAPQNPWRDPADPSERTPQSPLRGKCPQRASRRVVPLGWRPSGTLETAMLLQNGIAHWGVSRLWTLSLQCMGLLKSVPRVSPECQKGVPDTLGTHFGLWGPGLEGPRRHPVRHSLELSPFSGTFRGHFGPKGPRDSHSRLG